MNVCTVLILIVITIFWFVSPLVPPLGVLFIAGCGADFLINICLTILGYLPGHIHAFYLMYVFYERREAALAGILPAEQAPGVYSDRINTGGVRGYSTLYEQRNDQSRDQGGL
ncbi:hypothetical protein ABW21_db0200593 [Orbilia brochopaga]|nr:hypothetical protein ABW21_db0200593 [Drechslerella brochopaga]